MCLCCCFPSCSQHNENEVLRAVNDNRILRWCKLPLRILLPILISIQIVIPGLLLTFSNQKEIFQLVNSKLENHRIIHDYQSENTTGKYYTNLHNYPILSSLTFSEVTTYIYNFYYYFLIL